MTELVRAVNWLQLVRVVTASRDYDLVGLAAYKEGVERAQQLVVNTIQPRRTIRRSQPSTTVFSSFRSDILRPDEIRTSQESASATCSHSGSTPSLSRRASDSLRKATSFRFSVVVEDAASASASDNDTAGSAYTRKKQTSPFQHHLRSTHPERNSTSDALTASPGYGLCNLSRDSSDNLSVDNLHKPQAHRESKCNIRWRKDNQDIRT
ncbi:uncharacterized protein BDZ99DRAFT_479611 [Mytilinidion resinicola]|uniref:Uncharacterized protein n=1 Tax=Mytilinidion resinicola TaxID=574789 RepID=A0A6A6YCM1_9PEZI|nr:uncharacterized protein BDZ99DRAFT_479611 [Mytilinidion resinicola]KAF2806349.1 hypothetical protein BDZ99DRAFT_479611 [Mytilinidion resinicola]